jgi:titin
LVGAVAAVNLIFIGSAQASVAVTPDCTLDAGATCRILVTDPTQMFRWDVPSHVSSFTYKVVAASGQLPMLHNILSSPLQVVQTQAAAATVDVASGTVAVSGAQSVFLAAGGAGVSGQRTGGATTPGVDLSLSGGSGAWYWYPYQGGLYGNFDATVGGGGGAGSALFVTSGAAPTASSDRVVVKGGNAASTAKVPDRSVYLPVTAGAGGGVNALSGSMFSNSFSTDSRAWGTAGQIEITYANLTVPGAPTVSSVVAGDGQATVNFTAPVSNGGATITNYEYSLDGGTNWIALSPAQTSGPILITGLLNGTSYPVALRAINALGSGAPSITVTVMPRTIPSAPAISSVAPSDGQLFVSFAAPASDGGSAIVNYDYSLDGGSSWMPISPVQSSGPIVINGLTNGVDYQVALRAVNSSGASASSNVVSATPRTTPGAPTLTSVVSGNERASIVFTAPSDNGGAEISNYEYSLDAGTSWIAVSPAQVTGPIVVEGLANGQPYTVSLRAINAAGPGSASTTESVTPTPIPDAVLNLAMVSKSWQSVTLNWSLPVPSSPTIQGYVLRWSLVSQDTWHEITVNNSSVTSYLVSGLAPNEAYKFQISAYNEVGTSSANETLADTNLVSASGTVAGIVGEHDILTLSAPAGMVFTKVDFASYGTPNGYSSSWCSSGTSMQQVASYFLGNSFASIPAVNGVFGDPCFGTVKRLAVVLEYGKPEFAVSALNAISLDSALRVSWVGAASVNQDSHLTYLVSTDDGHHCVTSETTCVIGDLENGHTYSVTMTVSDDTYGSPPSNSVLGIPGVRPGAPSVDSYVTHEGSVTLSLTPPSELNAIAVDGYDYSLDDGLTWSHFASMSGPYLITGLSNGTTYQVRVRAVNVIGFGAQSAAVAVRPIAVPVAPINLAVSGVTRSAVNLTWEYADDESRSDITDYVVQYRPSTAEQWQTFQDGVSTEPSAIVTGLASGTAYDFKVAAVNSSGTTWSVLAVGGDGLNVKVMHTWEGATPARTESGRSICRETTAANVDFNWGLGAPVVAGSSGSCPADGFMVHATGFLLWPGTYDGAQTQTVNFYNSSDDGFSVSINGAPVIENWQEQGARTYNRQGALTLLKGHVYSIDVWHYENAGAAEMALYWYVSGGISAVPQSNLFTYDPYPSFVTATPVSVADAPAIQSCTPGDSEFSCAFSAPSDNGGAAVSNYEYSTDGGSTWVAAAPAQTTSPLVIQNLVNGQNYSIAIRPVNAVGSGASSSVESVKPSAPASKPSIVGVSTESGQVTLSVTAPAQINDSSLSGYDYSIDDGVTWSHFASVDGPFTISGLTNGLTYQVKVRAVNSAGAGAASDAVSVKPVAPASAPSVTGVVAGNGQAALTVGAPAQINDSSLSGYDYSINNGVTWSHFASVDGPFVISGLTNGSTYQVKVRAVNSAGAGAASGAVAVKPTKLVPAKPVMASLVAGNGLATVTVATPSDATAQSITGYQYSINRGAFQDATISNGSFVISGLTNGVSVSITIRAVNVNGNSVASVSKFVVPVTTPQAPTITSVVPSAGALTINLGTTNTGGSAITRYQYSLDGGSSWISPTKVVKTSPIKITGLANATTYSVRVRAVNAVGIGAASEAVTASTPALVATAPVISSLTAGKTSITVNFTAPTNNGGASITNYAYTVDGTTWVTLNPATTSSPIVITGLTSYKTYSVKIRAINSAGQGALSNVKSIKTLK